MKVSASGCTLPVIRVHVRERGGVWGLNGRYTFRDGFAAQRHQRLVRFLQHGLAIRTFFRVQGYCEALGTLPEQAKQASLLCLGHWRGRGLVKHHVDMALGFGLIFYCGFGSLSHNDPPWAMMPKGSMSAVLANLCR